MADTVEIPLQNGEIKVWEVKAIPDEVLPNEIEALLVVLIIVVLIICYLIVRAKLRSMELKARWKVEYGEEESSVEEEESPMACEEVEGVPVIRLQDISMQFRINEANITSLKEYVIQTVKKEHKYRTLDALDQINLEILKGEIVGIIGTNGSGKSTLLKIISGVLKPTNGSVEVDYRKVQLLTLGMGFDHELTARENVYLNGAMVGYSKEFIDEKYDYIVEFAELEGFMEEKIKNFSSGMVSRLGFAIATAKETPEILILDEVLSVGDLFFRQKSEKRIKEMINSGSTVIIVSHGPDTIIKNCTKAVWIEKGHMRKIGTPQEVCNAYRAMEQS